LIKSTPIRTNSDIKMEGSCRRGLNAQVSINSKDFAQEMIGNSKRLKNILGDN